MWVVDFKQLTDEQLKSVEDLALEYIEQTSDEMFKGIPSYLSKNNTKEEIASLIYSYFDGNFDAIKLTDDLKNELDFILEYTNLKTLDLIQHNINLSNIKTREYFDWTLECAKFKKRVAQNKK